MPTVTRSEFDRWQIISAACLISATGAIFYNILPIFVGAMQDTFQLDHARTGFIPSVFYTGFGLISASAYFWIRRVNWKKLALACIPATLLSLLLLVQINSYGGLLAAILLAGIGFGIMYSLGSTIIGDTAKPARYFGMKIGAEVFIGVILLFSIPSLVMPRWGFTGTVYALAGCVLALGLSFAWIPEQGLKKQISDYVSYRRNDVFGRPGMVFTGRVITVFQWHDSNLDVYGAYRGKCRHQRFYNRNHTGGFFAGWPRRRVFCGADQWPVWQVETDRRRFVPVYYLGVNAAPEIDRGDICHCRLYFQ